jgi:DNA-directed RNA polymerase II subunit RPB2
MEIECNWAHGIMGFLKERFMECSDNYRLFVCRSCGGPGITNPELNKWTCKRCPGNKSFAEIRIPYACKQLLQEIQTVNIGAQFLLDT